MVFGLLRDDTNVRGVHTVEFLRELRRQLPVTLTISWDRGNVHDRSNAVRASLVDHPSIETESLPSYTPEANPDQGTRWHAKRGRMANSTPADTPEPVEQLQRLYRRREPRASFIRHVAIPIRLRLQSR